MRSLQQPLHRVFSYRVLRYSIKIVQFVLGQVVGAAVLVFGVIDRPNLFERSRRPIVQIGRSQRDIGQLGAFRRPVLSVGLRVPTSKIF